MPREEPRTLEDATRIGEIVGKGEDRERVGLGLDLDREPAGGERVGIGGGRGDGAGDDPRLVALEAPRDRLAGGAGEGLHADARAAEVRVAAVGTAAHVGVRGLDGVDVGGGEERRDVGLAGADALRVQLARAIGRCSTVGDEGGARGARGENRARGDARDRRKAVGSTSAIHAITLASRVVAVASSIAWCAIAACDRPATTPGRADVTACADVWEDASAGGPLGFKDAIVRVEPLKIEVSQKEPPRLEGATVYVRQIDGVSPASIWHVLECHLTRRVPCADGEVCPPEIGRLQMDERTAGTTVVIDVRAASPESAREALRRARALTQTSR